MTFPQQHLSRSDQPRPLPEDRLKTIREEIRVLDRPGGPRVGPQGGLPDSELIWIERCRDLLAEWDARGADLRAALERAERAEKKLHGKDMTRGLLAKIGDAALKEVEELRAYAAAAREVLRRTPGLGGPTTWPENFPGVWIREVREFLSSPTPPAVSLLRERLEALEQMRNKFNADANGLVSPCARCGRQPILLDYIVSDAFWKEHVPKEWQHMVVCFDCLNQISGGVPVNEVEQIYLTGQGTRFFVALDAIERREHPE